MRLSKCGGEVEECYTGSQGLATVTSDIIRSADRNCRGEAEERNTGGKGIRIVVLLYLLEEL
jgi:hypothetical protein